MHLNKSTLLVWVCAQHPPAVGTYVRSGFGNFPRIGLVVALLESEQKV